jgi:hypothetical protein
LWVAAQESESVFSMDAQLRTRGEYRNGALFPRVEGALPATFINDRARLSMNYKSSMLELKVSGQHVGVWGQDPQIDPNGRFMLNESWGKLKSNGGLFAQIGRQILSYDDDRILGSLDWNVSGRSHDALKLGYEGKSDVLHLILAFNRNNEGRIGGSFYNTNNAQPYKTMHTLWYHHGSAAQPFGISLLAMNLGWQLGTATDPSTTHMQTLGTYLTYKSGAWDINGSLYYQTGKNASETKVSAFLLSAFLKYAVNKQFALGAGSDYLSGDDSESAKFEAFNPLYGTHHKFYGTMDYFYANPFNPGLNPGLWDNQLAAFFKTSKTTDLSVNYHYFLINQDIRLNNEEYKKGLGSEFDLQLTWSVMPNVKLLAGYSFYLGTQTMDIVKGGAHKSWQDWGWVSVNITPQLFSSKK